MSTRSNIYIEADNGYVGCYCHYDGYPSLKVPQLFSASYDEIYGIILKGTAAGGIEASGGERDSASRYSDVILDVEYSNLGIDMLFEPYDGHEASHVSYVYIKRKDGSVEYTDHLGQEWKFIHSESDLEQMLEELRNEMW